MDAGCCDGLTCADAGDAGVCCSPLGGACDHCCTGVCDAGACACLPFWAPCVDTAECCAGECDPSAIACCITNGGACSDDSDCCDGYCGSGSCE